MSETNELVKQGLDKILIGEFIEPNFPFQFDSTAILQNKRDWIFQDQIKITKNDLYVPRVGLSKCG